MKIANATTVEVNAKCPMHLRKLHLYAYDLTEKGSYPVNLFCTLV